MSGDDWREDGLRSARMLGRALVLAGIVAGCLVAAVLL